MTVTLKLSTSNASFEASGSEEYVNRMEQKYKTEMIFKRPSSDSANASEVLDMVLYQEEVNEMPLLRPTGASSAFGHPAIRVDLTEILDFDPQSGEMNVFYSIPGQSKKEQQINFAIIYCFVRKQFGMDEVSAKDLKSNSENQGVLDANNFSTTLTSPRAKQFLIVKKKDSAGFSYKINAPGLKEAEVLVNLIKQSIK
jgi:hypothetical protein